MDERRLKDQRKVTGGKGEEAASDYLEQHGYVIIERNWRCRSGELDIIAEAGGVLVFVEVRTRRTSARFGTAAESVDYQKQRKVRLTAQVYMQQNRGDGVRVRFDVIAVTLVESGLIGELRHYEGAF